MRVAAGVRYGELGAHLQERGWALATMASLPHISVGGAIATGTHGSGDRTGSLAAAVRRLEYVAADGELRAVQRGDPDFAGHVVALGALGVTTHVTLDVEPAYDVRQDLATDLPWDDAAGRPRRAHRERLQRQPLHPLDQRPGRPGVAQEPGRRGARRPARRHPGHDDPAHAGRRRRRRGDPAGRRRRPVEPAAAALPPRVHAEPRGGAPERVPPAARPRRRGGRRAARLAPRFVDLLQVSEVRTIAADDLWLSGAYGADAVGLHFTWVRDSAGVHAALPAIEDALLPLGARPHWGKCFLAAADRLAAAYPRLDDFRALAERLDPERKLRNDFLRRHLGLDD